MVDETTILSSAPTQAISSIFITRASCAIPLQTEASPVSLYHRYARLVLVPAVSACLLLQYGSSPSIKSGKILQNAFGYNPLSRFSLALCSSFFYADQPLFSNFIRCILHTYITWLL